MKTYSVEPNQTLLDIAVQLYGDANRLWELAAMNGLSPTSAISAGTILMHNAPASPIATALSREGRVVVTADQGGIGTFITGVTNVITT